ncbi:MAG: hypothetical protein KDA60_22015, partial [Planctomycetales bacterium]|nr:hypothetical protein [Planctomycetales bacterium]
MAKNEEPKFSLTTSQTARHNVGQWAETTRIKIYEDQVPAFNEDVDGPLELGRQDPTQNEPGPYTRVFNQQTNRHRLIVARYNETSVSRQHALVQPCGPSRAIVTALRSDIRLENGDILPPGESREIDLPHLLMLGVRPVRLESLSPSDSEVGRSGLKSLAEPTMAPGQRAAEPSLLKQVLSDSSMPLNYETFTKCLRDTIDVFEQVVSSPDFLPDAARTMLEVVDVDAAAILMREGNAWRTHAVYDREGPMPHHAWTPSSTILAELASQKRTLTFKPQPGGRQEVTSLIDVRALVAAPILSPEGDVIGAIYG